MRSRVFVRLLSNTNRLFVKNAKITAASYARTVLVMLFNESTSYSAQ